MKQCEAPSVGREREDGTVVWDGLLWARVRQGRGMEETTKLWTSLLRLAGIIACAHRRKQLHRKSAFSTGVALIALHRRSEGASFRRCPHPWELRESRTIPFVVKIPAILISRGKYGVSREPPVRACEHFPSWHSALSAAERNVYYLLHKSFILSNQSSERIF